MIDTVTGTVTGTVTDTPAGAQVTAEAVAPLYAGLQKLNDSVDELQNASMLNKASKAEIVLNDARDLLSGMISEFHRIKAEFERFKAEFERFKAEGFTNG